jgi:hypothetical protein
MKPLHTHLFIQVIAILIFGISPNLFSQSPPEPFSGDPPEDLVEQVKPNSCTKGFEASSILNNTCQQLFNEEGQFVTYIYLNDVPLLGYHNVLDGYACSLPKCPNGSSPEMDHVYQEYANLEKVRGSYKSISYKCPAVGSEADFTCAKKFERGQNRRANGEDWWTCKKTSPFIPTIEDNGKRSQKLMRCGKKPKGFLQMSSDGYCCLKIDEERDHTAPRTD